MSVFPLSEFPLSEFPLSVRCAYESTSAWLRVNRRGSNPG